MYYHRKGQEKQIGETRSAIITLTKLSSSYCIHDRSNHGKLLIKGRFPMVQRGNGHWKIPGKFTLYQNPKKRNRELHTSSFGTVLAMSYKVGD